MRIRTETPVEFREDVLTVAARQRSPYATDGGLREPRGPAGSDDWFGLYVLVGWPGAARRSRSSIQCHDPFDPVIAAAHDCVGVPQIVTLVG